jgi:hypothetical protein
MRLLVTLLNGTGMHLLKSLRGEVLKLL